jgi:tripartite-type tricarboxylate transporter receptor subunit TctC
MGQWLSEHLGHQFVIENRTGAGGNVGTEIVVQAPPDGYTLLLVPAPAAINATLYDNLNFNFIRDITTVAGILRVPEVMVVNPSLPANTVPEFIAYAKANPGKINMASAGNGSVPHVAGELFKYMAGVDLVKVSYRGGGPALIDLLGRPVQVMFEPTLSTLPYIRAGKLRALAVPSATRSPVLPDIPTVGEFVPGYEATAINCVADHRAGAAARILITDKEGGREAVGAAATGQLLPRHFVTSATAVPLKAATAFVHHRGS